jgi:hypothetical protein
VILEHYRREVESIYALTLLTVWISAAWCLAQMPQPMPPGPPPDPARPPLGPVDQADENFSFLRNPANRTPFSATSAQPFRFGWVCRIKRWWHRSFYPEFPVKVIAPSGYFAVSLKALLTRHTCISSRSRAPKIGSEASFRPTALSAHHLIPLGA